jgi:hypothetical protein
MAVKAGKALLDLPHTDRLSSRMDILRSSWDMYIKTRGNLSFPDCIVFGWCNDKGALPLTFDTTMQKYFEKKFQ